MFIDTRVKEYTVMYTIGEQRVQEREHSQWVFGFISQLMKHVTKCNGSDRKVDDDNDTYKGDENNQDTRDGVRER